MPFKDKLLSRIAPNLLAWPAWLRLAVAAPIVLCLWLAVAWANLEAMPW